MRNFYQANELTFLLIHQTSVYSLQAKYTFDYNRCSLGIDPMGHDPDVGCATRLVSYKEFNNTCQSHRCIAVVY